METILREFCEFREEWNKIIFSSPRKKTGDAPEKITWQKKQNKNGPIFFEDQKIGNKVFHKNLSPDQCDFAFEKNLSQFSFQQVNLFSEKEEISYRISKKGKVSRTVNRKNIPSPNKTGHNREKNYLIKEGDDVPFLVDLGVFTKENKVVHAKYDKFRQINRFVEILDHAFQGYEKETVSVLDFGCGKSYLTFFVYYYFSAIRKKQVNIIGYDLKEDVVETCNALAKKYHYDNLRFVVADVTKDPLSQDNIDFVLSLHACDVATDYALNFALEKKVPYIFSVPCCQHEINQTIKKGDGDLDIFLHHGLFKERMSALLTDAFRCDILASEGYHVDVLEFVDFSHSPKNIMIRARRKQNAKKEDASHLQELEKRYGFRQTLFHLRKETP